MDRDLDPDLDLDACKWSVDDVDYFFRQKAARYVTADLPHGHLPSLDAFLTVLHDNDVSGAILLSFVDAAFLREDCGLRKFGERSAVLHCIKKLQLESATYARQQSLQSLQISAAASASAPTPQQTPTSPKENLGGSTRSGEVQVQDSQGRKRRKLDMSKLVPVEDEHSKETFAIPQIATADQGFLSTAASTVDELFYGKTEPGQEIGTLYPRGQVMITKEDRLANMGDLNFHFTFQNKPMGESLYVYRQMRHFLAKNETIDLQRNNRAALAVVPYRDGLHESLRSATVLQFSASKDELVTVREHLSSSGTANENPRQCAGEWDFLVEKHKSSEDELLPVYGESDDEEGDGSVETTEGDIGEDAAEEIDDHAIHKDRVVEIIEEAVDGYIAKWRESLEKLERNKAWTVWRQTKGSRTIRDDLIHRAQTRMEHYTLRLNKIKKEIFVAEHRTEKSVQEACVSMEVTVESREEERWKIGVWKRKEEPFHVVQHGVKNTHKGLPTPLTSGKAPPPLQIHPDDRLSTSPAPAGGAEADVPTEDEILYEADDEEYHTPRHSPAPSDPALAAFLGSTDEMAPTPDHIADNELEATTDTETMPHDPLPDNEDNDSNYAPEDESPESDELASPSTFVKPIKSDPVTKSQQMSSSTHIDLTGLSSDSSTPTKKKQAPATSAAYQGPPLEASADMVDSWDISVLIKKNDRMRLLIKLLREAGAHDRDRLNTCLRDTPRSDFNPQLHATCQSIKKIVDLQTPLQQGYIEPMRLAATLCVSWAFLTLDSQMVWDMPQATFDSTLGLPQVANFSSVLHSCLQKRTTSLFMNAKLTPSKLKPSALIEISSDSQGPSQECTPHNKRKRAVQRSEFAINSRNKALQREQKFAESQGANSSQLAAMISSDPSFSAIEINLIRDEGDDPVYVCDRIARKMKAHQIKGVQFLWREVTAHDEDGAQGCVLAHTMGLGKTMQTIALLVAVNEAAQSKKKSIYRQIPRHLRPDGIRSRMLRILILCPPSLIENWNREIDQWAPRLLGHVFSLESGSKSSHMSQLGEWMRLGGVLLVGYEKFRIMVLQKPRANQRQTMSEEEQAKLKKMLLEGPEIVVADEAHSLKNTKSDIGKVAGEIKTHSRIGLTGTPMSNDVDEIYALISWVAPGYLGSPVEFRAHYLEPIKAGIVAESTPYEKKKSTMRLKVLHSEIQPKVDRANIEVLRGSLKPKVEFVITVPLERGQTELYKRYINALLNGDENSMATDFKIFGWLAYLTLLTNHPHCFRSKLLSAKKVPSKRILGDEDAEEPSSRDFTPIAAESGSVTPVSEDMASTTDEPIDGDGTTEASTDQPPHKLGLSENMIQTILDGFEEDIDPQLSAKMKIFVPLLKYSMECGDKVLVFSSSIPTLDYLGELLVQKGLTFGRIDGQKNMKKKMRALEDFDNGDFDIMLVSTRAGGVGLNIQGANRVFIFDFGFNPTREEQAIGRAYRLGQTKPVYVYRFVTGGTFEMNIYNKQLFKTSLAQRVVDKRNTQRSAKRVTRDYLYEPTPVKQENLNKWAGKDANVLDRLLNQHGSTEDGKFDTMIRAITTMETLQEETIDEPLNDEEQREVDMEIQQRRMLPKAKRGPGATAMPPQPSAIVKLPFSTQAQVNQARRPDSPAMPPPPSTYAGPSRYPGTPNHPLGGLPTPRTQQPYQQ